MSKEIKDYLHLYLGCDIEEKVSHKDSCRVFKLTDENLKNILFQPKYYKPILRPLSDMDDEEKKEYGEMIPDIVNARHPYQPYINLNAKRTLWALSKHFDLFSLIENGLAIDASTLK